MQKPKKGRLSPEAQQILDLMLKDVEEDQRYVIDVMTPQELEVAIEDARREETAEEFARFMRIVNEVTRKKRN